MNYCENCQCESCNKLHKLKCNMCNNLFLVKDLNEYQRCKKCEVLHGVWRNKVKNNKQEFITTKVTI